MARFKIYFDPKKKKLNTLETKYGEIKPEQLIIEDDKVKLESLGRTLHKKKLQFIDLSTNKTVPYSKLRNGNYDFYQITIRKKYMFIALIAFCILTPTIAITAKSIPKATISNGSLVIFILIMFGLSKFETTRAKRLLSEILEYF